MPSKTSLADTILEADQAVASILANADLLPSAGKYRVPLEGAVTELKGLSNRRQTLTADKQQLTQDLKMVVRRVKDLLIQLKAAVRSDIGPRSEKLVEFNMAPLRPRSRKSKSAEKTSKPAD